MKWVAEKYFIAQISADVVETIKAYEDHGHWIKMAIEDTLEVGAAIAIGAGVALVFASGGWVVVASAALVDITANAAVDKLIKVAGNHL